ncbi:hypothetical protein [Vibrio sp. VB16]|uniref:hypothetical protein n=1 Tax=Vibrio sp. VB16 TaxID=2785746 RepID=UPI00189EB70B|nr:hypothetical protein [Vibrio sp. VB16]UGA56742.1 hypothetical protein IUZ65_021345 [Vibrio sp. VB16]
MKKFDITFLHTDEIHINNFQLLIDELAPELTTHHIVNESLLLHAQKYGVDSTLTESLNALLLPLSEQSRLLLCTCSSIGSVVEKMSFNNDCSFQRIDRAMANDAVEKYQNILVVAALESTIEPTKTLLEESCIAKNRQPSVDLIMVKEAWSYFLSGQQDRYLMAIVDAVQQKQEDYDAVILAQASMAAASTKGTFSIPVLSSPKLGIIHALDTIDALT